MMDDPDNLSALEQGESDDKLFACSCMRDPFADLPPELRPKPQSLMGGLRKVTCPGCGLVHWTNRSTDLCMDCGKKGGQLPNNAALSQE